MRVQLFSVTCGKTDMDERVRVENRCGKQIKKELRKER